MRRRGIPVCNAVDVACALGAGKPVGRAEGAASSSHSPQPARWLTRHIQLLKHFRCLVAFCGPVGELGEALQMPSGCWPWHVRDLASTSLSSRHASFLWLCLAAVSLVIQVLPEVTGKAASEFCPRRWLQQAEMVAASGIRQADCLGCGQLSLVSAALTGCFAVGFRRDCQLPMWKQTAGRGASGSPGGCPGFQRSSGTKTRGGAQRQFAQLKEMYWPVV